MKRHALAELIRDQRISLGLTQKDVAQALGCRSPQEISLWERGLSKPSPAQLNALNKLLRFDPTTLNEAVVADFIERTNIGDL